MPSITDIAARFHGTITFKDNTYEHFHTQLYRDQIYSIDTIQSRLAEAKLKWFPVDGDEDVWWLRQRMLWRLLPFITAAGIDTFVLQDAREINSVVMHVKVDFQLDNGQNVSASVNYDDRGWIIEGTTAADLPFIDNMSVFNNKLEDMLRNIVSTANLSP
jgi:hypothetical protein